jgi:hypothetical protein
VTSLITSEIKSLIIPTRRECLDLSGNRIEVDMLPDDLILANN